MSLSQTDQRGNNPNASTMQYQVDLEIDKVNLAVTFPCQLCVVLKRGKNWIYFRSSENTTLNRSYKSRNPTRRLQRGECSLRIQETLDADG